MPRRCAWFWVWLALAACGRRESTTVQDVSTAMPLQAQRDTAERLTLPAGGIPTPAALTGARATLVRVSSSRVALDVPLPEPGPAQPPEPRSEESGLPHSEELRPPIPRGSALFVLRGRRPGWVELDVRVDELGSVSDAEFVAGDADSATRSAATEAAFAMRWYPALLRGRPIAVWSRQRFEVSR